MAAKILRGPSYGWRECIVSWLSIHIISPSSHLIATCSSRIASAVDNNADPDLMLLQEAEGTVCVVVPHPADCGKATKTGMQLSHVPLGVWVRMDKCSRAPSEQILDDEHAMDKAFTDAKWQATHTTKPPKKTKKKPPILKCSQRMIFVLSSS